MVTRLNGMGTPFGPLTLSVALVLWAYVSSLCLVFGALLVGSGV